MEARKESVPATITTPFPTFTHPSSSPNLCSSPSLPLISTSGAGDSFLWYSGLQTGNESSLEAAAVRESEILLHLVKSSCCSYEILLHLVVDHSMIVIQEAFSQQATCHPPKGSCYPFWWS